MNLNYCLSPYRINRKGLPEKYTYVGIWNGLYQDEFGEFFKSFDGSEYIKDNRYIPLNEEDLNFIGLTMTKVKKAKIFEKTLTIHKISKKNIKDYIW